MSLHTASFSPLAVFNRFDAEARCSCMLIILVLRHCCHVSMVGRLIRQ